MIECGPCGKSFKTSGGFARHSKTRDHRMRTGQFDLKEFLRVNKVRSAEDLRRVMAKPYTGKIRTL